MMPMLWKTLSVSLALPFYAQSMVLVPSLALTIVPILITDRAL
jgi:hypothetical protein